MEELIIIYKTVHPLFSANLAEALRQSTRNSNVKTKLGSRRWVNYLVGRGRGGSVAESLFRRRVRKMANRIAAVGYFYMSQKENQENIKIVQKIIHDITTLKKEIEEKEKTGKIASIIQLTSVIVGIVVGIITITGVSLSAIILPSFSWFIFIQVLLPFVLEIPLLWVYPGIRWYRTVIEMYEIKSKEANVYDSLIPMETIALSRAFPKFRRFLDEQ